MVSTRSRILVLLAVVGFQSGTGLLHATLGAQDYILSLYYSGIIISAAFWGYWGGLTCASFSTVTFVIISWKQPTFNLSSVALYTLFFYLFAMMVGKLVEDQQVIHRLAITDALTGVFNRYYFMQQLKAEVDRCQRYGNRMSLLMVDIDRFKQYNDRFGHQKGDQVLREVAYILRSYLRSSDTVYRYGGEEFGVILPEVCAENASVVADRLRSMVEEKVAASLQLTQPVTVSIGVADCCGGEESESFPEWDERQRRQVEGIDQLLERADQALYEAKSEGRNCVRIWGALPTPPPNPAKVNGKVIPFEPRSSKAEWQRS